MYLTILTILMLYSSSILIGASTPLVTTPYGVLSGVWDVSQNGRKFASFKGIPYAAPPIGNNRFREPQTLQPWTGVWNASNFGSFCLSYEQFRDPEIQGSEDCLFLNIYSPTLNSCASLPVFIYIHGGAYLYGSSNIYLPHYLIDRNLVVVTLNYRLGPLGFLSTGDTVIPGNAGLKDQSRALHWVKENIAQFGGDPDNVLLTGNSAGGASVHYHYLSPLSRGTFTKGISFSGTALTATHHQYKPLEKAKTLAAIVGCPTNSSKNIRECLLNRPAQSLVQAQVEMMGWKIHEYTMFTPTTESSDVINPFITQYPYFATEDGQMAELPLIASVCSEEGLYPASAYQRNPELYLTDLENHWEQLASSIFEYNDTLPIHLRPRAAKEIKEKYLHGKSISQKSFSELVHALGDRLFIAEIGKMAQIHALKSLQPVYMYRFAFRGNFSLSNLLSGNRQNYGVSHADDILHIFLQKNLVENQQDSIMSNKLLDIVQSFATTGIPQFEGATWNPLVPGSKHIDYLDITAPDDAQMKTSDNFGNKTFWDHLGFNENENYRMQ